MGCWVRVWGDVGVGIAWADVVLGSYISAAMDRASGFVCTVFTSPSPSHRPPAPHQAEDDPSQRDGGARGHPAPRWPRQRRPFALRALRPAARCLPPHAHRRHPLRGWPHPPPWHPRLPAAALFLRLHDPAVRAAVQLPTDPTADRLCPMHRGAALRPDLPVGAQVAAPHLQQQ